MDSVDRYFWRISTERVLWTSVERALFCRCPKGTLALWTIRRDEIPDLCGHSRFDWIVPNV